VLGLALDLSLRNQGQNRSLDGFMALMWDHYGKPEIPYSVADIESTLAEYAGEAFAQTFFDHYIYHSEMPDYQALLNSVGISLSLAHPGQAFLGASMEQNDQEVTISRYPLFGTPAYIANLEAGDKIRTIDDQTVTSVDEAQSIIRKHQPGDTIQMQIERFGKMMRIPVLLMENPQLQTELIQAPAITDAASSQQKMWLTGK